MEISRAAILIRRPKSSLVLMTALSEGSVNVRRANKKSAKQLCVALKYALPDGYECTFSLADELSEDARAQIWQLIDGNMRELCVDSSLGWEPLTKQKEIFDPLARYITLSHASKSNEIVGYSAFRFEHEEGEDILYCYELEISPLHQRKGLGKVLMKLLEAIGRRTKMEKIMLTVLDNNTAANNFYRTVGFLLDECSPTYEDSDDEDADNEVNTARVDYQILSKLIA